MNKHTKYDINSSDNTSLEQAQNVLLKKVNKKKKILFYYHHFGGYGHGMRILSICKALQSIGQYDILVINSGKKQPELGIDRYARVLNLPPVMSSQSLFGGLRSDGNIQATLAQRQEILKKIADKFNPDLVVIEHFPFGRQSLEGEINRFIHELKKKKVKVYSSVRDLIHVNESKENYSQFNGFFIHEDPAFEVSSQRPNNHLLTGRVHPYGQFIAEKKDGIRKDLNLRDKKLIIVSIGGGMDGHELLEKFIKLKLILDQKTPTYLMICTGAAFPDDKWGALNNNFPEECQLNRFSSDLMDYVHAADLFVSMGGYNSVNSHLLTSTPSMIFPRLSDKEQSTRAERYGFKCYDYEEISEEELLKEVNLKLSLLSEKKMNARMNGAQLTARFIIKALELESAKIRVTTLCNLDCAMCGWIKKSETLEEKRIYAVIDDLSMLGVRDVNFTGGEPTSYPGFVEIIKYTKEKGFQTLLSTNGFNQKILTKIVPYLDKVDISIDSHLEHLNDVIRARKGAYAAALKSVRYLSENGIKSHINVTVRPDNYKDLYKIIQMLLGQISSISFTLVDTTVLHMPELKFSLEKLKEYYTIEVIKVLKESLEHSIPVRIKPFFHGLDEFNSREVLAKFLHQKEEYFARFQEIFALEGKNCRIAKEKIRINSNGEVRPCCYLDDVDVPFGNVNNKPLKTVVVDDRYFNDTLIAKEGVGTCSVCQRGYEGYKKLCLSKV